MRTTVHRVAPLVLFTLLVAWGAAVRADDDAPLTPDQAKNHVGKEVVVSMKVRAAKKSPKRQRVFLDSLSNFQDPDNLGIAVSEAAEADLARQHAATDIAAFFLDKTIRVSGTVVRRDERTYIDVTAASQISLIVP